MLMSNKLGLLVLIPHVKLEVWKEADRDKKMTTSRRPTKKNRKTIKWHTRALQQVSLGLFYVNASNLMLLKSYRWVVTYYNNLRLLNIRDQEKILL